MEAGNLASPAGMGDAAAARGTLRRVIAIDPGDEGARDALAQLP